MKFSLLFAIVFSSLSAFAEVSLRDVADGLGRADCYMADTRYEVYLPNASEPVTYRLHIAGTTALGDTLAPCNYLIEWESQAPDGATDSEGFSSYFDGNYFRYRNGKLAEYHHGDDPMPFAPRGLARGGVQMNDQFASLLPAFLADRMREMASDTAFAAAVETRGDEVVVKGRESRGGYVANEFTYRFGAVDFMPRSWEMVTNPGQLGEQTITAEYRRADGDCPRLDEASLIGRHPAEFAKYRRDSFSLESLRGEPLPGFSAPMPGGGRYSRQRGEGFGVPTIIAVVDSKVDATARVVADLREAVGALPGTTDLVIAFTDNDRDAIEEIAGSAAPGVTLLMSARELAANCGVADTPSVIFCRADGTVADIHVGRNNELRDIVIQKAAMAR